MFITPSFPCDMLNCKTCWKLIFFSTTPWTGWQIKLGIFGNQFVRVIPRKSPKQKVSSYHQHTMDPLKTKRGLKIKNWLLRSNFKCLVGSLFVGGWDSVLGGVELVHFSAYTLLLLLLFTSIGLSQYLWCRQYLWYSPIFDIKWFWSDLGQTAI